MTVPFVHLRRVPVTPTSEAEAANLSARLSRVAGEAQKEEALDQLEAFKLLSLDEMGQAKIDFGSAQLGRCFSEMWDKEGKYVKWFQASYHSSNKVSHQEFIHYISQRVTYAEHQMGLNSQDPQPSPSQRPLHPAIKSKAKAKPIREVTPQDLTDLAEDESMGTSSGARDRTRDLHGDGSHGLAPSDHRGCDAGDHCPPPGFMSSSWLEAFEEADVHVSSMSMRQTKPSKDNCKDKTHSLSHKFHALVQQVSKEASLAKCDPTISNGCSRLHLLDVFCHEASELTKQVQSLGGRAHRFGRAHGDLKTKEGISVVPYIVEAKTPPCLVQSHLWAMECMGHIQ